VDYITLAKVTRIEADVITLILEILIIEIKYIFKRNCIYLNIHNILNIQTRGIVMAIGIKGRLVNYWHMLEPIMFMPRNFSTKIWVGISLLKFVLSEIFSRKQTNFDVHKLIRVSLTW